MKLLGAREFIKMPVGTFYIPYWENTTSECFKIIERFKENALNLLSARYLDLHIFGDNDGSMSFSVEEKEDNYIFYYDANVVGDACPATTLYLVIDESELPNEFIIDECGYDRVKLLKNELIEIKNLFISKIFEPYSNDWAIKELDKLSSSGNMIVDVNIVSNWLMEQYNKMAILFGRRDNDFIRRTNQRK